jgi:hypothetical protein
VELLFPGAEGELGPLYEVNTDEFGRVMVMVTQQYTQMPLDLQWVCLRI